MELFTMIKIRSRVLFYMVLIAPNGAICQNLILNPSFEEQIGCPKKTDQLDYCLYWKSPLHTGTPDYFSTCENIDHKNVVGVPANYMGSQIAHSGKSYVGILNYFDQYLSCQEYLQTELKQSLIAGKKYKISLFISLSEQSKYFNDQLQFSFSQGANLKFKFIKGYKLLYGENVVMANKIAEFTDTCNWQLITATYKAVGGEKYLTIGVFKDLISKHSHKNKLKTNLINPKAETGVAYYYIDDVSVELVE